MIMRDSGKIMTKDKTGTDYRSCDELDATRFIWILPTTSCPVRTMNVR